MLIYVVALDLRIDVIQVDFHFIEVIFDNLVHTSELFVTENFILNYCKQ